MDGNRFDSVVRELASTPNRRSLLKAALAGVIGIAAGNRSASAEPRPALPATLILRNAGCPRGAVVGNNTQACYQYAFGPVEFMVGPNLITTDERGNARTDLLGSPTTIEQEPDIVGKSRRIYVKCIGRRAGRAPRRVYDANARNGAITISVRADERITCDWYNIWTTGQPRLTTTTTTSDPGTTTTTADPGTTTTTSTTPL